MIAAGDALLAPSVTRRLIERFADTRDRAPSRSALALNGLTDREREVLTLIGRGLSNGEIASGLFIGEQTVKTHVSKLLQKVPARDRVQLVIIGVRRRHRLRPAEAPSTVGRAPFERSPRGGMTGRCLVH